MDVASQRNKETKLQELKPIEVFSPGTFPKHTYVDRNDAHNEEDLSSMLKTPGMLVSIAGPSKSGKTVLVEKIVGTGNLIPITGAGIRTPEDLWRKVLRWMGESEENIIGSDTTTSGSFSAEASGKVGFLGTGAEAKAGVTGSLTQSGSENHIHKRANLETIIKEIAGSEFVVFIDDFHYINKDSQVLIAQEIKEAIRNNIKIVTATIPYRGDDSIRANPDLRGRVFTLDLNYWEKNELKEIANLGLPKLKFKLDEKFINLLAENASGSPQLMQQMMLSVCNEIGVEGTLADEVSFESKDINFERIMERTALSADYNYLVEKILDGPKTRGTERKEYKYKNGKSGDVYKTILIAISRNPPSLYLKYDNLQDRVKEVCRDELPSGSSIIGSCGHIANISNEISTSPVIEWDPERDTLHIRDPYLLFFIRWSTKFKVIK